MNYALSWGGGIEHGGTEAISIAVPPKKAKMRAVSPVMSPRSTAMEPSWIDCMHKEFSRLPSVIANWDGRGASATNPEAYDYTWSVLGSVMNARIPAPAIVPLGDGGLLLVWNSPSTEIEVEVSGPNRASIIVTDKAHDTDEEIEAKTDFSRLSEALKAAFPAAL